VDAFGEVRKISSMGIIPGTYNMWAIGKKRKRKKSPRLATKSEETPTLRSKERKEQPETGHFVQSPLLGKSSIDISRRKRKKESRPTRLTPTIEKWLLRIGAEGIRGEQWEGGGRSHRNGKGGRETDRAQCEEHHRRNAKQRSFLGFVASLRERDSDCKESHLTEKRDTHEDERVEGRAQMVAHLASRREETTHFPKWRKRQEKGGGG